MPSGGNPADRLDLGPLPEGLAGGTLSLERCQAALGDAFFVEALGGKNPALLAALKSLPLRDAHAGDGDSGGPTTAAEAAAAAAAAAAASAAAKARGEAVEEEEAPGVAAFPLSDGERALAAELRARCDAALAACATTVEADEAALAAAAPDGGDPRRAAALRYRAERKRLLGAAAAILRLYLRA